MAEVRPHAPWVVLPCVETMAQAAWLAVLRPAAEWSLLPVTLLSTLPFRVQRDSPDVIVLAGGAGLLATLSQRGVLREVFADTPTLLLTEQPSPALLRSAARLRIASVLPLEISPQQWLAGMAATAAGLAVSVPQRAGGQRGSNAGPRTSHTP